MPDDILNAMRGLREDMRQRLLQSPEYRALEALDAAIDEIGAILNKRLPFALRRPWRPKSRSRRCKRRGRKRRHRAPPRRLRPRRPSLMAPQTPAARHQAIADAFAETLAANWDPRNGARAATAYQPARHSHFE